MRVKPRSGKVLNLRQAEAEYGIPYARIYDWVHEGKLPRLDDGRRSYLIKRSDLDAFIDGNMTEAR